jgi:hypothetical protein
VNDHEVAADVARRAGELLMRLRGSGVADDTELRTRGDAESNEQILAALRRPARRHPRVR